LVASVKESGCRQLDRNMQNAIDVSFFSGDDYNE